MTWTRAALVLVVAVVVGLALVSGGSSGDPETPRALPGLPPPFLGTALAGGGAMTAAVDAYGDVVDLRPSPAGPALIDNPSDRQAAGTVAADTGIVPRLSIGGGPALAPWRADSVRQRYLPGTNMVRTELRFGRVRERVTTAVVGGALVVVVDAGVGASAGEGGVPAGDAGGRAEATDDRSAPEIEVNLVEDSGLGCTRANGVSTAVLICAPRGSARRVEGAGAAARADGASGVEGAEGAGAAARVKEAGVVERTTARLIRSAVAADRAWLARARPLGPGAPVWAERMYARSLLTLRALTDRRTGAVAAGARDGWAYVWPRDAGTAALALAASGYAPEARRAASFLSRLDLAAAARFDGRGHPVPGRAAQGDATGWAAVAAHAAGLPAPASLPAWRDRADYQEGTSGDYLANAIASSAGLPDATDSSGSSRGQSAHRQGAARLARTFGANKGLIRRAGDPESGLDSAAAWAVRPFPIPALYPAARATLLRLARDQTRFGITPGEAWSYVDPWMAPTAWSAWAFAALGHDESAGAAQLVLSREESAGAAQPALERNESAGSAPRALADRRQALRLLGDLRRAATPAGALPERVDAATGIPRSTTPLAWPHAFAILALHELWPTPAK